MADKKKNKRKFDEDGKPSKQDYAVAKFLRFNVPAKDAKLHSMEVHCFFASAAIDALLVSKWSASKNAKEPLFFNRSSCVNYCQRLIEKGLFHRAERVQRKKDKGDRSKKKKIKDSVEKDSGGTGDELRERKNKKEKKEKKEEADAERTPAREAEEATDDKKTEETKDEKKDEKKKKEKPMKLVMTDDQRFLDGEENIYVWIYDPVSAKTLFIGSLIVFGAAALCLFPLWPEIVRVGVYYVSLTGAGFVGFILSLVVVRLILFCAVWLLTLGRHNFWLLPNLTEDVGFFESFKPLYKHDVALREQPSDKGKVKSKSESSQKSKGKAKGKNKSSDKEDSGSEHEFEMIDSGDLDGEGGGEPGEKMEGEEESEENAEEREEVAEEEDADEDEEDEDEDAPNDGLEEDYDEQEEDVHEEEEEDVSELKKDK